MEQAKHDTQESYVKQKSAKEDSGYRGIKALLDKNNRSLVRLPMLEAVYEKFVKLATASLRSYIAGDLHIEHEKMRAVKFADYIQEIPTQSVFAIFKMVEFGDFGLISIHGGLLYHIFDMLLGGRKLDPSPPADGRRLTAIECDMSKQVLAILLDSLSLSFEIVAPLKFQLEQVETDAKFARIIKPSDMGITFSLHFYIPPRDGRLDIMLPYSALEPIHKLLTQPFIHERVLHDPVWFKHLEKSICNVTTTLRVELKNSGSKMQDLLNMQVGHTLILDKFADEEVDITINGIKVTNGKIGKVGDKIAVQLVDDFDIKKFNNIV
ncbi:FliM/FliN family flagellar motor switch protein [Candidatus Lariskella endosymbiont of Hedychridium roseum]|uniref:FliM/FliN family flagellar motor switch protein n=1 Tax=Candidatus Lariskella endosymbiont of Hedychridium roseum TaxID=3077949 RepID=UPI0030CF51B7